MISYLQIENLTKSYGTRMLFDSVTFGVNQGDKIGLIARNGSGKTTLLRIIAGKESPDSGSIVFRNDLRVGIVEQMPQFDDTLSVIDACLSTPSPQSAATAAYEQALIGGDSQVIAQAMEQMDALSAWDYDDRLKQMLHALKITDMSAQMSTLSGGQKKRVAIAHTLLDNPDLLILDEPTNHLDIEIIEWLEEYLRRQNVTLLMVTHDRYFLDSVCNKIIEIDNRQIYTYQGNYNEYLRRRNERIETMTAELAKVKNTLRREQEWMRRQPQARAGKAKYRIDSFYDLRDRSHVKLEQANVDISAIQSSYIGSKIFEAKGLCKSYGDKCILDDFTYTFARYEKLGIIGANGVGKSTLIKILQGIVTPDSGTIDLGTTVRFGYYSQDGISFRNDQKVIDAVTDIAEHIVLDDNHSYTPMQFLSRFLFSTADQQKYIHTLSGGELCRLHLATVLMRRPNFLILDEPTNDLDIVTLAILEDYLRTFSGCLIVVSHDRFFLDSIVDHLWVLEGNGVIKDFPGNYSDYRAWVKEFRSNTEKSVAASKEEEKKPRLQQERKPKMSFKERREFEQLTDEIDCLTAEKNELTRLFESGDVTDIEARSARYSQLQTLLDEKEMRWLELSELQ